jgi:hypothetical protein
MNDMRAGQLNNALGQAVASGTSALGSVPVLLKKIIKEEGWRSYVAEMTGQRMTFSTFREFALARYPGLGSNFVDLSILCEKDPEALELLNEEWRKGSPVFTEEKIDLSEIEMNEQQYKVVGPALTAKELVIKDRLQHAEEEFKEAQQ